MRLYHTTSHQLLIASGVDRHAHTHAHTHILTSWIKVILKTRKTPAFGWCTPGLKITSAAYYVHTNSLYTTVSLPLIVNSTVALGAPTGKLPLLLPQVYVP